MRLQFGATADQTAKTRVVIVTGLAGAGKTTALKAFEDLGFEAVDNLPISLLPKLLSTKDDNPEHTDNRPLAIGVDSRTRAFRADTVIKQVDRLRRRHDLDVTLLFFECDDDILSNRFSETRRRHPLAQDRPVRDGIAREREIMGPLREMADMVLDTTGQTALATRNRLRSLYRTDGEPEMSVTCMSFGFSRGVPRDADLVFDVRFLRNPHYVDDLRPLTGQDERVATYVVADDVFPDYFDRLSDFLRFLVPLYQREGKSYLTVAFGCTGGRHRSVVLTDLFGRVLEKDGYRVNIVHRDATLSRPGK